MISFLRKLRKSFFGEKSIVAYLAYALSEIVLVVIGILIAVTINNWNEERKQKDALDNIYTIILEDLKNDLKDIDGVVKKYEKEEKYYNQLIHDSLDDKTLRECEICPLLVSMYSTFNIEKRGYNLLLEYKGNAAFSEDTLVIKINQFYAMHIKFIDQVESYIQKEVSDNLDDWKGNHAWFNKLIYDNINDDEFWEYMRSNDYKNKLSYHYLLVYDNYIPYLKSFEHFGGELMESISDRAGK